MDTDTVDISQNLSHRQRKFVAHYVVSLNATEAAIKAGYSKRTAGVQGYDLLKRPHIKAEAERGIANLAQGTAVTQERVIFELARLGFSNALDYVDKETGQPITDLRKLTRDAAAAITQLDFEVRETASGTTTRVKYKLSDKKAALELVGKHLGMFAKEIHHSGNIELSKMTKEEADQRLIELKAKLID